MTNFCTKDLLLSVWVRSVCMWLCGTCLVRQKKQTLITLQNLGYKPNSSHIDRRSFVCFYPWRWKKLNINQIRPYFCCLLVGKKPCEQLKARLGVFLYHGTWWGWMLHQKISAMPVVFSQMNGKTIECSCRMPNKLCIPRISNFFKVGDTKILFRRPMYVCICIITQQTSHSKNRRLAGLSI